MGRRLGWKAESGVSRRKHWGMVLFLGAQWGDYEAGASWGKQQSPLFFRMEQIGVTSTRYLFRHEGIGVYILARARSIM